MDNKGQGSLEYLLLIGGAVAVAAIVIGILMTTGGSTGDCTSARARCVTDQGTLYAVAPATTNVGACSNTDCATLLVDYPAP